MSVVALTDVEFTYPSASIPTLRLGALSIQTGETVFLYGPSGSGKTTLLEILAGVLVPQKGSVKLLETDLATLSSPSRDAFRAAHLGYVFQSFNLIPYLDVSENIALPLHLSPVRRKRVPKADESREIMHLCDRLGIAELLKRPVSELSVGQQQRVAAARALLGRPEILLADEPTSALDYDHREKFIHLLFDACKENGSTVIFVSHDRTLEKQFDRSISLAVVNQAATR